MTKNKTPKKGDLKNIIDIAKLSGIKEEYIELYGNYKAKVNLRMFDEIEKNPTGNLILVSAIPPTPAGEEKTTVSIELSTALNKAGVKAAVALWESSMGPLFWVKGEATEGIRSQALPVEDTSLHFTRDLHAVSPAHNLLSVVIDNHIFRRKSPQSDPRRVSWTRVIDMNDRSLMNMITGLGGRKNGVPIETSFQITASSKNTAILCLSRNYEELKEKISNILVGYTFDGEPVFVKDLEVQKAASTVLKDALKPNLVQTTENPPAFVYGEPFANIAQGRNSIVSIKLTSKLYDNAVIEACFVFNLGAEKFFGIVARYAGFKPSGVVLVATVRALKMHGGKKLSEIKSPDPEALKNGLSNLERHLENISKFGMKAVVEINKFSTDIKDELKIVKSFIEQKGFSAFIVDFFEKGGKGRMEIYGSRAIDFTKNAISYFRKIKKLVFNKLTVCIAKTQKSLSDNPELLGRPKDFLVTVREIKISSGAGFTGPVTGDILLMPGLPKKPAGEEIELTPDGKIVGIS